MYCWESLGEHLAQQLLASDERAQCGRESALAKEEAAAVRVRASSFVQKWKVGCAARVKVRGRDLRQRRAMQHVERVFALRDGAERGREGEKERRIGRERKRESEREGGRRERIKKKWG